MVQNTKPTLFIKGWINRSDYSWSPEPHYWFSSAKASSDESICVCEHTIAFQVPLTEDEIIQARVGAMKAEQAKQLTRYLSDKQALDDKIANLLCLPSPKAVSPDSEGGAEVEDIFEVPNDGFAPDETSFG